jgi:hypothetical protein
VTARWVPGVGRFLGRSGSSNKEGSGLRRDDDVPAEPGLSDTGTGAMIAGAGTARKRARSFPQIAHVCAPITLYVSQPMQTMPISTDAILGEAY